MKLTKKQARLFLLKYQGLLPPHRLESKSGIMQYINKVGSIQYDPLSIIDLNSHLVLQSRIKNYNRDDLTDLLYKDRLLIDDWDKNQCIYSVSDWPYFKRYRKKGLRIHSKEDLMNHEIIDEIKSTLSKQGPLSTKDLDYNEKVNWFWGDTRLSKVALETMYIWGDVVISYKEGIRKYYDLTEKVLPKEIVEKKEPHPKDADFFKWIVKRRIGSVGLLWDKPSDAYLGIYYMKSKERHQAFADLLDQQEIIKIEVEDVKYPLYIRSESYSLLNEVLALKDIPQQIAFIAPLDNLIWDRKLIKELFDFEYTWEVYKPKSERIYGYYVLPVLHGDQFIGRIEPVLDRKTNTLIVRNFWYETHVKVSKELVNKIKQAVSQFANYLNASNIQYICDLNKK